MSKLIKPVKFVVMRPEHPLWINFYNMLSGPEGCNFREDINGTPRWNCDGTLDKSIRLLKTIPDIDIEQTIEYFEDHGGYCDCEVIINVDKDEMNDIRTTILERVS